MAEGDSRSAYLAARKLGRKYLSEHSGDKDKGYLHVLEDNTRGVEILAEINLGYHEIPLSRIAGTRTAARSNSFAGNFMPLLGDDTEFAIKWKKVYESQLVEGIREPIKVYEYINHYYVLEGNKRVSILKYVGAASVYGNIIRLLPERDETNDDISIFYEMLDYDKKMYFEGLWFHRRGNFTRLIAQTEKFLQDHPEVDETVEETINNTFRRFRKAFREAKLAGLELTAGDAMVEYGQIFGYPYGADQRELARNIRKAKAQFQVAEGSRKRDTMEVNAAAAEVQPVRPRLRKTLVRAAFAFDDDPQVSLFTRWHCIGIDRIERKYKNNLVVERMYNVNHHPGGTFEALKELAAKKPDVLFTTSPTMSDASLRIALENPELIVLNCDRPREGKNLNTYFSKMFDMTFLCGVLAGAMSQSGIIGYMNYAAWGEKKTTYEINAFALGARLINPRCRTLDYTLRGINSWKEHDLARETMAANGADVAFCRHSPDNPLDRAAFPEIYAQLYGLSPEGYALESYAGASFDWEHFYDKVISDAIEGRTALLESRHIGGNPIHFGWGMSTGIMDIYPVNNVIGERAARLLNIFRDLVREDRLTPFEGPVWDRDGVLRIDHNVVPPLLELQRMTWLESSVEELNPLPEE